MKMYRCNHCGQVYLECDLIRTKCSENMTGAYLMTKCPKCMVKLQTVDPIEREEAN